ncbi:tRNA (uridine(54)-C5)-methyltransferase TrmA [Orbaceae bacterium ac157xtp]
MQKNLPIEHYPQLLKQKVTAIETLFNGFALPSKIDIFASPVSHYRMRAEFGIWHDNGDLYHIMYQPQSKQRYRVDEFPIASKLINQVMQKIIPLLKQNDILKYKLFQIDYLSTLSNKILVSLIYHKKLDENWIIEAKKLKNTFQNDGIDIQIIGRATKQKICLDNDYLDEELTINNKKLIYRQIENSFTQPNAQINIAMLNWVIEKTKNSTGDLLELYCGNGNFSIALAQNFTKVLATEIAKSSVNAAQYNIEANQANNVKIIRLSAEEFTQAINKEREFNRLKGIDLNEYQCNTVLVDPPRSGLDDKTVAMIQNYENIIYISCNPLTLKENLHTLNKTHKIKQMAIFDQFPYTPHCEIGTILQKS